MKVALYIVSTPIGNLKDFSARGKETLSAVDIILCEDTRITSRLLGNIGLEKKLIVYNDHNATDVIPHVIKSIKEQGTAYALVSDAGTPLISDPGYKLVNACIENNIKYSVIPGACAVISALVLSGQPSDRFLFAGFADQKKFEELSKINSTIILFEAPHRLINTVHNIERHFKNRTISIVREMTKIFEEVITGDCAFLIDYFEKNPPKGEIALVISPPRQDLDSKLLELTPLVTSLRDRISTKELSEILSKFSGISKNRVYNFIQERKND
ncbi:MAG: 16S rRNA (cytidine(1402)-2'-O)-methyltransferase [Holosporales bacterium]|jgi:16S rRNA (cytidine1402-2'-O)-methyltransferase|nr:16S rRNA (cytidine(1402)-2'-O)-methyltransferase [Holosporales bacterium]